jgi:hypothetical protein
MTEDTYSFEAGGETIHGRGYRLVGGDGDPIHSLREEDFAFGTTGAHVCKVAGISQHQQEIQSDEFAPGRRLQLVPDPKNPYDPNAIEIRTASGIVMAGFVPREIAAQVAPHFRVDGPWQAMCLWEWRTDTRGRIGLQVLMARGLALAERG